MLSNAECGVQNIEMTREKKALSLAFKFCLLIQTSLSLIPHSALRIRFTFPVRPQVPGRFLAIGVSLHRPRKREWVFRIAAYRVWH